MLIWDIIRDWFVMNIWGGYTSAGVLYNCHVGNLQTYINGENDDGWLGSLNDILFHVGKFGNTDIVMSLSDWLSTTSTIIVLVAVCVGLFFLVRYFFRMFAGLLSGR